MLLLLITRTTPFPCRCKKCEEQFFLQPKNILYNDFRTPNCSCYRRRKCGLCGKEFNYEKNTQRCCNDCQETLSKKTQRLRVLNKKTLVDYKGGKCGYDKCLAALHFHHLDPSTKLFGISDRDGIRRSPEEIAAELDKCILVCANCHAEIHWSDNSKQED